MKCCGRSVARGCVGAEVMKTTRAMAKNVKFKLGKYKSIVSFIEKIIYAKKENGEKNQNLQSAMQRMLKKVKQTALQSVVGSPW